jgi:CheY-like chemotaxis protein
VHTILVQEQIHTDLLGKTSAHNLLEINTQGRNWVIGDVHQIQQVLTNVVSNAIKYTTFGSITLTVGWDEHNRVQFECVNTGPGIPLEQQVELFQRFVKCGGAPGTGLGLAIGKHIIESMQGLLYFESNPTIAPGATCIVVFPVEECKTPKDLDNDNTTKSKTKAAVPIEEALSFLIVDDIKMNRMMLQRRFQKGVATNCTISEACTGEALEICRCETFDVIIVDQFMEGAGGILLGTDTIIAMKRMGISSLLIGCSGNDMNQEFKEAGAYFAWKNPMPANREIIKQLQDALVITIGDAGI